MNMLLLYFLILPLLAAFVAPLLKPKAATYLTSLFFLLPFFAIIYGVLTGYTAKVPLATFSAPIGDI